MRSAGLFVGLGHLSVPPKTAELETRLCATPRMQTAFEIAGARDREANIKVKRYVAKPPTAQIPTIQATL